MLLQARSLQWCVAGLASQRKRLLRACRRSASQLGLLCLPRRARAAEARRWQAAVDQQAGALSEARVEAEAERRRCRDLEQALAEAQGEREAARADAAALLAQLRAAEATSTAVEGGREGDFVIA